MTDKQIIIDGVQFNKFGDFYIDYELNGHFTSISSSAKEYKILKSLIEQLKRKEQECEELKKIYKELQDDMLACNKCRTTIKIEQQLDQLKASLEEKNDLLQKLGISATGEFKRIKYYVDKLVVENDELKEYKNVVDKLAGMQLILTNENGVSQLYDNAKDLKLKQLKQALLEVKELIRKAVTPEETKTYCESLDCLYEALKKCEVLDEK